MTFAQNNTTDGTEADIAAIEQADIDHAERLKTDAEYRNQIALEQVRRIREMVGSMEESMSGDQQGAGILSNVVFPRQTATTLTGVGPLELAVRMLRDLMDIAKGAEGID